MALVPMAKVEIIGPKNQFFDVVSLIHDQGKLHIEDLTRKIAQGEVPLERMEVYESQQAEQERMDEMLVRVRAILKALDRGGAVDPAKRKAEYARLYNLDSDEMAAAVAEVIEEVEDRTSALASSHASIEGELSLLGRYEPILHKIQPLAKQIVTTGAYESVALLVERRYKSALQQLKEELDKITKKQCEIVSTDVDEDTTAAIVVFSKAYSEPVHKFLAMENVNQIRLPSDFDGMPFDVAYDELKQRRMQLPADQEKVGKELDQMSAEWQLRLTAIRDVLIDKTEQIQTIPKFGRTEYAFVVTGWMPAGEVKPLRKELHSKWGDDIIVEQKEIKEEEFAETPVQLTNPKAIAPFQNLLGIYGMPKYGGVDPTMFLFVFYPFFFGMIVGDMGYGLVMLAIVLWIRFRYRDNEVAQMGTSILGPAATMVIAFGFLYGEFFGDLLGPLYLDVIQGVTILGVQLPFVRTHLVELFMLLAIAVGVIHVLLGLIMGIINAIRTKHKKHLYEKAGILTFLVAIGIAVALGFVAENWGSWGTGAQLLFAAVAFGGFIFAIRGGGIMGVVETVESVAHMASYIRIMAVGLAGAIFADAINSIVAEISFVGLAVVVAVILHSLAFVIAAFSPTIHALRLNFLEFFGKFYETGNKKYDPFTKTGGEEGT